MLENLSGCALSFRLEIVTLGKVWVVVRQSAAVVHRARSIGIEHNAADFRRSRIQQVHREGVRATCADHEPCGRAKFKEPIRRGGGSEHRPLGRNHCQSAFNRTGPIDGCKDVTHASPMGRTQAGLQRESTAGQIMRGASHLRSGSHQARWVAGHPGTAPGLTHQQLLHHQAVNGQVETGFPGQAHRVQGPGSWPTCAMSPPWASSHHAWRTRAAPQRAAARTGPAQCNRAVPAHAGTPALAVAR